MSKMHHECGIVAFLSKNNKNIIPKTISNLLKLQHRGQDSAGICYIKDDNIKLKKNTGLIKDVLNDVKDKSSIALAHTRYATFGDITAQNAQPVVFNDVALAHNGTIFEIEKYKNILIKEGYNFDGTSDSEVLLKWLFYKIKKDPDNWTPKEIKEALNDIKDGAWAIILFFKNRLIALKDDFSYRPLVFIETDDLYCLASENIISKAKRKIELKGNSIIEINKSGYKITDFGDNDNKRQSRCPFEVVYFAKHNVFNFDIKKSRMILGDILASYDKKENLKADYIVPILNSGLYGAKGYSKKAKIKLKKLIKLKNPKRTFIENNNSRREAVEEKYVIKNVKGKNIILVDDSIVRGTTSKKLVEMLKKEGAKKIHLRLTSPMIINSCFWGVDIPDKNDLLAYNLKSCDNIKKALNVDSVKFIGFSDFFKYFNNSKWCNKCFKELKKNIATKAQA